MGVSRKIDVRKQRNMTFRETVGLCLRGVSERMLRSVLTLSVVSLAVAFFMFLLSENRLITAVAGRTRTEMLQNRTAARWMSKLFADPSRLQQARTLARASRHGDGLDELAAVVGWDQARLNRLAKRAAEEAAYLTFFDEMKVGKRAVLVGKLRGRSILKHLLDPDAKTTFDENIRPMTDLRVPGGLESFTSFLEGYDAFQAELTEFADSWSAALAKVAKRTETYTAGAEPAKWAATASDAELDAWGADMRQLGFELNAAELPRIKEQSQAARQRNAVVKVLQNSEVRANWRKAFRERKASSLDEKLVHLDDKRVPALLGNAFDAERLSAVAQSERYARKLDRFSKQLVGRVAANPDEGSMSGRQIFLLVISFVVCMVGITNAMLMSITERFREIATMKCLGATDRFILVQFMTEAGLQGVFGGVAGMLIGFLVAVLKNVFGFGGYVFGAWPGVGIALAAVISVLSGVFLAVLASMYPAGSASRMAPMEAMRVE